MIDTGPEWLPELLRTGPGLVLAKFIGALAAGFVLGFDREKMGRSAGLRTHMLVSLAAAATAVLALDLSDALHARHQSVNADPMRIIEGVVAAVGFIGGGIIIRSGGQVRGLTTAANLWICGVTGLAFGAGFFALGALVLALAFAVLVLLRGLEIGMGTKPADDGDGKA
ncbi:MgtC/SapB family protein [Prosthecomicrobium sp. N25]|uniref:MgtC/SapB family protein n=1 Tax=Prosthecomicrobium sp. N25 TaxID=3129254 RepID=UPI003076D8AA